MFNANFYICSADPRERDKTSYLTQIGASIPLSPTATLDIMTPKVIIDYNASLIAANYVYIPEFNRYYFARPPKVEPGKRIIFECSVDLLMSLKEELKEIPATIIRSESVGAPTYIPDSKLPINPVRVDLEAIKFSSTPFIGDGYSYILTTLGGGANINEIE